MENTLQDALKVQSSLLSQRTNLSHVIWNDGAHDFFLPPKYGVWIWANVCTYVRCLKLLGMQLWWMQLWWTSAKALVWDKVGKYVFILNLWLLGSCQSEISQHSWVGRDPHRSRGQQRQASLCTCLMVAAHRLLVTESAIKKRATSSWSFLHCLCLFHYGLLSKIGTHNFPFRDNTHELSLN